MLQDGFSREYVTKVWGVEEVVENNELYCGKLLRPQLGYQSSLHYHRLKDETFLCLQGEVALEVHENSEIYHYRLNGAARGSYRLLPGTPHRFRALQPNTIVVEFSTPHSDDDVVRIEESGRCD